MGTRGACGFRLNGQDKLAYNHFDSYPSGLGSAVTEWLLEVVHSLDWVREVVGEIEMVSEDASVTPELVKRTANYHNMGVSGQSEQDPYCLFRNAQGDLGAYIEMGLMLDAGDFIKDSLFYEWGYVVNLDDETLDVWKGAQMITAFPFSTLTVDNVIGLG